MLGPQRRPRRFKAFRLAAASAVVLVVATACGGGAADQAADEGGATPPAEELPTVTFLGAANPPIAVAVDRGYYEKYGLNVVFQEVGEEQATSLFFGGDAKLGASSPWVSAKFTAQGNPVKVLSTAGATNFINGVLVRAEDADQYAEVSDLQGKTLGIPGFGSGTWQAFAVMMDILYGFDAKKAFNTKTASPGALLGLLGTGEIESALLFSGQTVVGVASDQFERIFSFSRAWQERTGEPMVIDVYIAKAQWAKQHPDLVKAFIRGTNDAAKWMIEHPEAFSAGGEYAELARGSGWLTSPEANEVILQMLADGELIFTAQQYDQSFIDAMYRFITESQGVLIEEGQVPPKEEIFYAPDACC